MREIKFRAWDEKTMIIQPICSLYGLSRFLGFLSDNPILMQYIGRKDKNNKSIYEGDILKNRFGHLGIIKYETESWSASFIVFEITKPYNMHLGFYSPMGMNENFDELSIIGNI